MRIFRAVLALTVFSILAMVGAPAAWAGGSWFDPIHDRYEPGDEVTLIGYTGGGTQGWVDDGPFFGYLVEADTDGSLIAGGQRTAVGEVIIEDTGRAGYLHLRASITFVLPADLAAGTYFFDYCNDGCAEKLGDLIGGYVYVGIDPNYPIYREWPLDDPAIADLEPDALIAGPGFDIRAGDVQSGSVEVDGNGFPVRPPVVPIETPTAPPTPAPSPTANPTDVPRAADEVEPDQLAGVTRVADVVRIGAVDVEVEVRTTKVSTWTAIIGSGVVLAAGLAFFLLRRNRSGSGST